ncbi:FtsX-like permease family protein [Dactylosporangium sp. AC04546]|uniref:ABC transporter permease n=1 Tax=Dactylosporangium sp. AC04546 TaxID=2862460 RepID=UPI001EDEA9D4|nr:ABC transporter permease [Dactylosporangium sp. AC04546]WVK81230.1 FtsX-like permease family protein [Dactylosporangium sp. AC04546]
MSLRSRLRASDALSIGTAGIRARRTRSTLSALGIAIAIAALVAVQGVAESSKQQLLDELGRQGNLLTVATGQTFDGRPTPLPVTAQAMIARIPPVLATTAVGNIDGATVRRTDRIPPQNTNGITVLAAQPSLPSTLSARMLRGSYLGPVAEQYPETVLGYSAARSLGIDHLDAQTQVFIAGRYFTVVGVLDAVSVAPEIDTAALVSFGVADRWFGLGGVPTRIYLRVHPDRVAAVAAVLGSTASPENPRNVQVQRPSDVIVARLQAKNAFVGLFLALGAIALLIAGVGIANIMVISVLERRAEIGLRRSLGARRRDVAAQFLLESALLALVGGLAGVALGCLATVVAAHLAGNPTAIPPETLLAGLGAALLVGTLAGLYPAARAARLPPADALRTL